MLTTHFDDCALMIGTYNPPLWPAEAIPMFKKKLLKFNAQRYSTKSFNFTFSLFSRALTASIHLTGCLLNVQTMQCGKRLVLFLKNALSVA